VNAPVPAATSPTTAAGGRTVYATTVTAVGPMVPEFVAAGVLVLFGEQAPQELHDFSVLHRVDGSLEPDASGPLVGDVVRIGDVELPVLAVGSVVAGNLLNLGHLDLKADGRSEPAMPGDVCVPTGTLPPVEVGQSITIVRPASSGPQEGSAP
jgi:PTS system glucitol/sorbitol-specific IIA component